MSGFFSVFLPNKTLANKRRLVRVRVRARFFIAGGRYRASNSARVGRPERRLGPILEILGDDDDDDNEARGIGGLGINWLKGEAARGLVFEYGNGECETS